MKIGFTELLVVFIVALLVIGPDKLPQYAKKLGEAMQAFRKASDEMTRDIKDSVIAPLEEAQQPLRDALEPVNQLGSELQGNVKEVEASFKNIGKPKPKAAEPAAPAQEQPEQPLSLDTASEQQAQAQEEHTNEIGGETA